MVICYSAIFLKLDRYEQKVLRRENPISVSYKTKVAKMMFTVLIVFVLLRVPFTTLIFIRNHMLKDTKVNQVQGAFDILWYCSHYLMFCNAAINPIIYGLTNDNFRKAYRQTPLIKLFCNSTRVPNPRAPKQGGPCHDRRIQNMLLDQGDNLQSKADNGQTLNVEESSPGTETSNIWYTKKTAAEGPLRGISTNLIDSETDPLDYDLMENSESQEKEGEEAKDPQEKEKGISGANFI